ncbi:MAG: hypothetical protein ABJ308_11180 [Halieaceae bacterium]
MIGKSSKLAMALLALSLGSLLVVEFAEARRGGGMRGGGMRAMRGGPAASGSFNRSIARPSRSPGFDRPARQPGYSRPTRDLSSTTIDRDRVNERVDNRQDYREQRRDRVDDYYDDRRDWYEDRWRTGAYLSIAAWNRMSCPYTTTIVDNITYYDCYGVRYERVYRGTEITYIIVN